MIITKIILDQNMAANPIQTLADSLNMPLDLIKTMLLMFSSIPLSYVLRSIKKPKLRYAYSLIIGLIYVAYLLQQWTLYVLAAAIVPFTLMKIIGRYHFEISLLTTFSFLLCIHIYRFIYDYMSWKIDCSVTVMYIVTKTTYYGNYIAHHKNHPKNLQFFKFMSYCFYFPSILIGPTYNYTIFQNFIEKKNGYQNPKIKTNLLFWQALQTLCFTIATVILMPIFTPYWALKSQFYLNLPPILKFLSLNIIGVFYRIKFYTAWGFTQISLDLSGLSWDQKQQNYNMVRCGSPRFQTELNPRNKTAYWNTSIQLWLKQIIFDKIMNKTKSSGIATFITFLTSAVWHGVYLTYYIGFIQWAVIIIISKWAYRMSIILPKISNSMIGKIIAFIVASSLLNYTGMFIVVLTWNEAVKCYNNMDFIGNILMFSLLIASTVIKPKMFKSKEKHTQNQVEKQTNAAVKNHNHKQ